MLPFYVMDARVNRVVSRLKLSARAIYPRLSSRSRHSNRNVSFGSALERSRRAWFSTRTCRSLLRSNFVKALIDRQISALC